MAIIISRNNFGKPLDREEQQRLDLTGSREVARTLEQVLMRLRQEAKGKTENQKAEAKAEHRKADESCR